MKKASFMLLLFWIILALVACGKDDVPTIVDEKPDVVEDPIIDDENLEELPFKAPLTGIGSAEEINRRIIAVMINNHGQARPQSGLDKADIVYEVLAEGWITRLMAVYQSQSPEVIGPVRSLRPYLIDLATGFDAVFAHAGGSQEALDIARYRGLPNLDEIYNAGPSFYRVKFRKAPHNLYTNLDLLREGMAKRKYSEESTIPTLVFKKPDEVMIGKDAGWIQIDYHSSYYVSYEYDPETLSYKRSILGKPHLDMETNEQLSTTNLLVIETNHKILDNVGRRAIDVMTEGKGYLFQRGKMTEVDWKRVDGVIRPFKDGQEVGMYPGNTWVNIIPNKPGLEKNVHVKASKESE